MIGCTLQCPNVVPMHRDWSFPHSVQNYEHLFGGQARKLKIRLLR